MRVCVSVCARICVRSLLPLCARMRVRARGSVHACVRVRVRSCAHASEFCRSIGKYFPACVCVGVRGCVSACGRTVCMRFVAVRALWWHGGDVRC